MSFQCDACLKHFDEEDEDEMGSNLCRWCSEKLVEEDRIDKENRDSWQG